MTYLYRVTWPGQGLAWHVVARTEIAARNLVRLLRADSDLPAGTCCRIVEVRFARAA